MIRVKATREGEIGGITAMGIKVEPGFVPYCLGNFFVALPSRKALRRIVQVSNPLTGSSCLCVVADIGPWNTDDDAYVIDGARPQAESGTDTRGRHTNRAGIDLSEGVWAYLGMQDNTDVDWKFVT